MIAPYRSAALTSAILSVHLKPWLTAGLLLLPVYLLYLANFMIPGVSGTGFLQYDQASYMADARAYFASGHFTLTYGLPFSSDPTTPRLYFQPLTLVLGLARKFTGSDPGILYMAAGVVFALGGARVAIELYQETVGRDGPGSITGLLCFFWGGGAVTLVGFIHGWATAKVPLDHMLDFDPFGGFWFLNLGRNFIFTTESSYHLIFLSSIVLVLRRRFTVALVCAALLSASHPFSGLQLIAVLGAWSIVEQLAGEPDRPPLFFPATLCAFAVFHLGYYLWFLDYASEEHRALQQQWALAWVLPVPSLLAGYGPVALLAAVGVVARWRRTHSLNRVHRLLLVWFAVSLALAKHDLLIAPVQPLHFTRGYIWTPLFLLGAPILVWAVETASHFAMARFAVPGTLIGLLLLDNAAWFLWVAAHDYYSAQPYGLTLDPQEEAVIRTFQDPRYAGYLVVSQISKLGYLATVYSPLRSWYSHRFSTPHAEERQAQTKAFFADGQEPSGWYDRPLLAVATSGGVATIHQLKEAGFDDVLTNDRFVVLARPAQLWSDRLRSFSPTGATYSSRRKILCCSSIP
jgi:hypothetical protein